MNAGARRSKRNHYSLFALALLSSGCPKDPPKVDATPAASSSAVTISPAPSAAPSASTAIQSAAACDFTRGFHGTVAGQEVFMRLARHGDGVVGRYFYAKIGKDIRLAGAVDAGSTISLAEGIARDPTAHFEGACDAAGTFSGTWNNGKGAQEFSLTPVVALEKPLVATKKLHVARTAKTVGSMGMKSCTYDQTSFELFGAPSREAESAINGQDAATLYPPILLQENYADVDVCETGVEASFGRAVLQTWKDFAIVEESGTFMYDGAAHPGNAIGYARETYDLRTGKVVAEKDVFSTFPEALVTKCVRSFKTGIADVSLDEDGVDGHTFSLGPSGVHVFRADYPFVAAVLTGRGPILSYAALLKAGALRQDSPVARAWEGVAPLGPKDSGCLPDDGAKE